MQYQDQAAELANLLSAARNADDPVAVPPELVPIDEHTADRVQILLAARSGPIAGYKVAQNGEAPGSFGMIFARDLFRRDAIVVSSRSDLKAEVEIAFRLARDLPGRSDGAAYGRADVEAALAGAVLAVEIVGGRLPTEPKPAPLLSRADRLGNFGLVVGEALADWGPFALPVGYDARLAIDGAVVVEGIRPHPSKVDPLHPMVWLANRLVRLGSGLKAGDVVTTGAFGGAHPIRLGQTVEAAVEGLGSLSFTIRHNPAIQSVA